MARIGIVGGGAAGLTLAALLHREGHEDLVIFEASERVGGKTRTAHLPGLVCDMTTAYLTAAYARSASLFMRYGAVPRQLPTATILDGAGERRTFRNWLGGESADRVGRAETARQLARYVDFYRKAQAGSVSPDVMAQPIRTTLRERELPILERLITVAHTGQFYGELDETTTDHVLRWNTPGLLTAPFTGIYDYPQGFDGLWRAIANGLDVRFGTRIESIDTSDGGVLLRSDTEAFRCDEAVIATDWEVALSLIESSELPLAKLQLGDVYEGADVVTCLLQVPTHPKLGAGSRIYVADQLAATHPNRVVAYRYQRGGYVLTGSPNPTSAQDFAEASVRFFAEIGYPDASVIDTAYVESVNPRLSPDAIRAEVPRQIAEMQGEQHVWYSGAWVSFESVANLFEHNRELARQLVQR